MSAKVKEFLDNTRQSWRTWGVGGDNRHVGSLIAAIEQLASEVDALKTSNEQPEIDWQRKFEALQEVHNEVHAALAKAGADIHDLANKGHAYAIEVLIAQRDLARRKPSR